MGTLKRRLELLERRHPSDRRCDACRDWPASRVIHTDPEMAALATRWAQEWGLPAGRALPERCPGCGFEPLTIVVEYATGWKPGGGAGFDGETPHELGAEAGEAGDGRFHPGGSRGLGLLDPERVERWRAGVVGLLETMPEARALAAYDELTTLPADRWGVVTRALARLAALAADGITGAPGSPERPWALPEAVCGVLEAHPDAVVRSAHDCEACGFMVPALRGRALLDTCPLCGGAVRWQGFNDRRWRALWERQKAGTGAG